MRNNKEYVWSWNQYYSEVIAFAKAMHYIGIEERKAVNIMGWNSPEWAISFFGSVFHNNVCSGVYITNGPDACQYQANHCEAQLIVVDTLDQLKLYLDMIDKLPQVKAIVCWGADTIPAELNRGCAVYTYKNFLELGKSIPDAIIDNKMIKQKPGKCCCLIYTSGTTGYPKGVMLSHDSMIFNGTTCSIEGLLMFPEDQQHDPKDQRSVSYLPLSHIAGLQFDLTINIIFGSQLYFAKPDALQGTLVETLQWARPTFFFAVPRVWEKFEDKLKAIAKTKPGFLQSISGWAKGHGYENSIKKQTG